MRLTTLSCKVGSGNVTAYDACASSGGDRLLAPVPGEHFMDYWR